jgi:NAD dependent epimerase/dehydratase family enzyme
MLGEFADEALLASARATPERLTEQGFQFRHGELDAALADLYSR